MSLHPLAAQSAPEMKVAYAEPPGEYGGNGGGDGGEGSAGGGDGGGGVGGGNDGGRRSLSDRP